MATSWKEPSNDGTACAPKDRTRTSAAAWDPGATVTMPLALFRNDDQAEHVSPGHPERPDRVLAQRIEQLPRPHRGLGAGGNGLHPNRAIGMIPVDQRKIVGGNSQPEERRRFGAAGPLFIGERHKLFQSRKISNRMAHLPPPVAPALGMRGGRKREARLEERRSL